MPIKPLQDNVAVKRIQEQQKTPGGIIIPDTAKVTPAAGEVVSVGAGVYSASGELIPTNLLVGDRVLFGKYSGVEVEVDGETLLILRAGEVLGILT